MSCTSSSAARISIFLYSLLGDEERPEKELPGVTEPRDEAYDSKSLARLRVDRELVDRELVVLTELPDGRREKVGRLA